MLVPRSIGWTDVSSERRPIAKRLLGFSAFFTVETNIQKLEKGSTLVEMGYIVVGGSGCGRRRRLLDRLGHNDNDNDDVHIKKDKE